ncbi:MAG TPA: branched-chain amino acid ABC transporter permease [Burkholderiales bacterium]|jgi:branched-subunit amino acid ABC-type transport system permease component|nr:branched-chain amino acid ABC transporter permease [Burkholderiales bacterium]HXD51073.1 branched-chain amino acid ABC transporter permease [Burkholderiales bacterium]
MLQTAFNGLITGIIVTLPALSVTLLFGVLKFPNFAVGAMMTLAAYMVFALNVQLGWPLTIATAAVAVAFGGLLIVIDYLTFRPLRQRDSITLMVASLGLGFVLENIARLAYGNTARSFAIELARPFRFLDIRMNREQMITVVVSTLAMLAMYFLLTRMPIGRAMRAVSDNPALALVRGIESPRIIRWTWFIAGMLLAVGGVLIGMDRALEPPMGSSYLIAAFAAAILGGLGSPLGAFVGALIIGIVSELATLVIPPNYRIGIPLCVIALILIFRPQGLFGQPYIRK